jgi:hypothetical protein
VACTAWDHEGKLTSPFIIDLEDTRWSSVIGLTSPHGLFPDVKIGAGWAQNHTECSGEENNRYNLSGIEDYFTLVNWATIKYAIVQWSLTVCVQIYRVEIYEKCHHDQIHKIVLFSTALCKEYLNFKSTSCIKEYWTKYQWRYNGNTVWSWAVSLNVA